MIFCPPRGGIEGATESHAFTSSNSSTTTFNCLDPGTCYQVQQLLLESTGTKSFQSHLCIVKTQQTQQCTVTAKFTTRCQNQPVYCTSRTKRWPGFLQRLYGLVIINDTQFPSRIHSICLFDMYLCIFLRVTVLAWQKHTTWFWLCNICNYKLCVCKYWRGKPWWGRIWTDSHYVGQ